MLGVDAWAPLRLGLEAWSALQLSAKFAVTVGDANGTRFQFSSEGFSMAETKLVGASLSKWPAAVMIAGLVQDGTLGFDDLASKWLPYWTTDPADPRSRVTLGHLLSFTSGFTDDKGPGPFCGGFVGCARRLYEAYSADTSSFVEPNVTWTYLSCHLQFAGAIAVAASGKPIEDLFHSHLYAPFNMSGTGWFPAHNPQMASGIVTTGDDFEQLLHRLLDYSVLNKNTLDQMETDYSRHTTPSGDGWFGHYGMGHWWECLGYGDAGERTPLPRACVSRYVQAGPGQFGFYPLLDRSIGGGAAGPARPPMYFSLAVQVHELP